MSQGLSIICRACKGRGWHVGECHPQETCGACDGEGMVVDPDLHWEPRKYSGWELFRRDELLGFITPYRYGRSWNLRVRGVSVVTLGRRYGCALAGSKELAVAFVMVVREGEGIDVDGKSTGVYPDMIHAKPGTMPGCYMAVIGMKRRPIAGDTFDAHPCDPRTGKLLDNTWAARERWHVTSVQPGDAGGLYLLEKM